MDVLDYLVLISGVIIVVNLINSHFFHRQKDIFLVLATFTFSIVALIVAYVLKNSAYDSFLDNLGNMEFEEYLMNSVLCFMLFAGSKDVSISKFKKNFKPIILLSLLSTAVSAIVFGLLFYALGIVCGFELGLWPCLLLGCIVAPTDPIAATGILSKMGLSKDAMNIIECESLFNDGAGVTLYVFVKNVIRHSGDNNFPLLMAREILGAIIIAFVISIIGKYLLKYNKDNICSVLISVLCVGSIYILCDKVGCSGAIASVICGMYFGRQTKELHAKGEMDDEVFNYYDTFWSMADGFFNSVLFAMIGICLLTTKFDMHMLMFIPLTIIIAIISRIVSVGIGAGLAGKDKIPAQYTMAEYIGLMTWCALRGGLSLALAMSSRPFLVAENYYLILNSVYAIIFFTVVCQGLTIRRYYQYIEKNKEARLAKGVRQ